MALIGVRHWLRETLDRVNGRAESRLRNWIIEREQTVHEREAEISRLHQECRGLAQAREAVVLEYEAKISCLHQEVRDLAQARDAIHLEYESRLDALRRREARLISMTLRPAMARRDTVAGQASDHEIIDTAFDPQAALQRWVVETQRFSAAVLRGSQRFIDPYIVERALYGRRYRMIIGTAESQNWYDSLDSTEAHLAQSLGMIGPGDVVLDCGCNQGLNSLIYADIVGASGKVVGFDPFPINILISRFNATLNRKTNIDFVQAGVSRRRATASVSVGEQCIALHEKTAPDLVAINLLPLDDYAPLRPNFLKIDVEGAEIDALAGAGALIEQRPSMYIEIHPGFLPRFGCTPMDVFQYIDLNHFQCFINYPGLPGLTSYDMDFELKEHCALFFVASERPPVLRYYPL